MCPSSDIAVLVSTKNSARVSKTLLLHILIFQNCVGVKLRNLIFRTPKSVCTHLKPRGHHIRHLIYQVHFSLLHSHARSGFCQLHKLTCAGETHIMTFGRYALFTERELRDMKHNSLFLRKAQFTLYGFRRNAQSMLQTRKKARFSAGNQDCT